MSSLIFLRTYGTFSHFKSFLSPVFYTIQNSLVATKTWNGSEYGNCSVSSCLSGFDLINNSCLTSCNSGFHRNLTTLSCDSNSQDCSTQIAQSNNATQEWNGTGYGTCTLNSCINGFAPNGNICQTTLSWSSQDNVTSIISGGQIVTNISGGTGGYNYSVYNNPLSQLFLTQPSFTGGVFNAGDYPMGEGPATVTVRAYDTFGSMKELIFTVNPTAKTGCSNPIFTGVNISKQLWDTTTNSYGSCIAYDCKSGYLLNPSDNLCHQEYIACDPTDSHKSTYSLDEISESASWENITQLINGTRTILEKVRGLKKYDNSSGTYSICVAHKCEAEYARFPTDISILSATCQSIRRECSDVEISNLFQPIENGNYISQYNDISKTWGNCVLDTKTPNSRCKNISGKTVEYRNFGSKEFCSACDNDKKAVFTRSGSPYIYSYTCESKKDKCNDNGTYTGTAMADRISSTDCKDEPRGLNGKIDQYGNPIIENTAYKFKSLPPNLYPNAKCFDGTQGGFLYRKGKGSGLNRWIIVLQGGGACGTVDSNPTNLNPANQYNVCRYAVDNILPLNENTDAYNRLSNYFFEQSNNNSYEDFEFNSSKPEVVISPLMDNAPDSGRIGILSGDPELNPDFYTWNQVFIRYCSQDLWSGNGGSFTVGSEIYGFNGYNILVSTFDYLKTQNNIDLPLLTNANNIVVSGYSAGGEGIFYHGNHIKNEMIGINKDVAFLIDSGWVNDYSWGSNFNSYKTAFELNWKNTAENIGEGWESHDYNNSASPHNFIGSLSNTIDHAFVIQDLFDFEFMSYNATLFDSVLTTKSNLGFSATQGFFKPTYVCDATTEYNSYKKATEWSSSSLGLMNYLSYDFNLENGIFTSHKIFNRYSGVIHSKGRHGYTTSNDWRDNNLKTSYLQQNKNTQEWFSQWYFNNEIKINATSFDSSILNNNDFTEFLNNTCNQTIQDIDNDSLKLKYLYKDQL